eukprot:761311-Hanusia_phi.AAC.5
MSRGDAGGSFCAQHHNNIGIWRGGLPSVRRGWEKEGGGEEQKGLKGWVIRSDEVQSPSHGARSRGLDYKAAISGLGRGRRAMIRPADSCRAALPEDQRLSGSEALKRSDRWTRNITCQVG